MLSPENTIIWRMAYIFEIRSVDLQQLIFKRDTNKLDKNPVQRRSAPNRPHVKNYDGNSVKTADNFSFAKGGERERGQFQVHSTYAEHKYI